MSVLTIAGQTIAPAEGSWKENAPVQGGSRTRAYAGNLRSTVRWTKRSWQGTTTMMLSADVATLRSAVIAGNAVSVGGDLIGSTISAVVTLGEITEVNVNGSDNLGFMFTVAFLIETV